MKILDLTDNVHIKSNQERDRKTVLAKQLLRLELFTFLLFGILNILVFDMYQVALIDFIGAACVLMVMFFFYKTQRLFITLLLSTLAPIMGILFFLHTVNHQYYSLIWIVIVPPGCVFLLGRKWGVIISLLFFTYILYFVLSSMDTWEAAPFNFNAVSNLVAVSGFILAVVIYYEVSRVDMYETLHKQHQQLKIVSSTDSLTGIYNRRKIESILEVELQEQANHGKTLSVMLMDVDRFKSINDNYGHHVGDQALARIGEVLRNSLDPDDLPGRWGGDEFLVVCPNTELDQAHYKAEIIMKQIMETPVANGRRVTISVGVVVYQKEENIGELLVRADEELYRVKQLSSALQQ